MSALLTLAMLPCGPGFSQGVTTIIQTVKQADPRLTWQTPTGITFGTALSSAQLNASAAVPGKFVYQPAAGAVLPPGPNTLSVSFQPDSANYLPRTATVVLNVGPSPTPGFTFALTLDSVGHAPYELRSGKTEPIHLTVARLLDFDQTVTFSCENPPPGEVCLFTPPKGTLLDKPLAVTLVFQSASGSGGLASGRPAAEGTVPWSARTIYSGVLVAGVLVASLRRRSVAASICRAAMICVATATFSLGCGISHAPDTIQQVKIVASTPYESHFVTVSVVVGRESGGRDPFGRK